MRITVIILYLDFHSLLLPVTDAIFLYKKFSHPKINRSPLSMHRKGKLIWSPIILVLRIRLMPISLRPDQAVGQSFCNFSYRCETSTWLKHETWLTSLQRKFCRNWNIWTSNVNRAKAIFPPILLASSIWACPMRKILLAKGKQYEWKSGICFREKSIGFRHT